MILQLPSLHINRWQTTRILLCVKCHVIYLCDCVILIVLLDTDIDKYSVFLG